MYGVESRKCSLIRRNMQVRESFRSILTNKVVMIDNAISIVMKENCVYNSGV